MRYVVKSGDNIYGGPDGFFFTDGEALVWAIQNVGPDFTIESVD